MELRSIQTCTLDGHLHSSHIPDVILIQLILLVISTGVFETCRELSKYIRKRIVHLVGYLQ